MTDLVAWWGAILSTITAIVGVARYLSERRPVKVEAVFGFAHWPSGELQQVVTVSIANRGGTALGIRSANLRLADGCSIPLMGNALWPISPQLPQTIEGGHSCELYVDIDPVLRGEADSGSRIVSVEVEDATGRHFRCRWGIAPLRE